MVILVGLGTAGLRVAELLTRAGVKVHGIDVQPDAEAVRAAVELGFALSLGDASDPHVLRQAGAERAMALLVLINDDARALRVGLAARGIYPRLRIILRVFSHAMLEHLPPGAQLEGRSLSELVAPTFIAATLLPTLRGSFTLGTTQYGVAVADPAREVLPHRTSPGPARQGEGVARLALPAGEVTIAPLTTLSAPHEAVRRPPGRRVDRLHGQLRRWGRALVIVWQRSNRALRRLLIVLILGMAVAVVVFATAGRLPWLEAFYFVISTLTTVGYGDISVLRDGPALVLFDCALMLGGALLMALVFAFITDLVVGAKLEQVLGLRAAARRDHVVVVGLGSVGYRCALGLKALGVPVVIVDPNERSRYLESARAAGLPVMSADAQAEDTLRRAGIATARALLCATSNDQVNVEVGLLARGLRPDLHVVLRVFDPLFATQVQTQLGMTATFSAAVLAAPGFAAAALSESGIIVPPPARLPGLDEVTLSLETLSAPPDGATFGGDVAVSADGALPLAVLHADGHCTTAPAARSLHAGDRVLLARMAPARAALPLSPAPVAS